ncbi:MAG: YncE family protein [Polyangiaceae bacterium]|nr:YncE family protein [Polyangiaceae bacterium]
MRKIQVSCAFVVALAAVARGGGNDETPSSHGARDRVFVADEESGTISIVEEGRNKVLKAIVLPATPDMFMPHNVQVAPDGKSVWVAAAPMSEGEPEKAFVLDPATGEITADIELGKELHVAHVVLNATSSKAYVSANEGNAVLEIDAKTKSVVRTIDLGADRGPHGGIDSLQVTGKVEVGQGAHGVVLSDDGALAYVTNLAANTVSVVDTAKMQAVATIDVGTKPNGISHWHVSGGMP